MDEITNVSLKEDNAVDWSEYTPAQLRNPISLELAHSPVYSNDDTEALSYDELHRKAINNIYIKHFCLYNSYLSTLGAVSKPLLTNKKSKEKSSIYLRK